MTEAVQILSRGLGIGSVYALLALGFVIIYKSTRVISFAQPAFMLAGAVLVTYLVGPLGFFVALPLAALGTAALALGVERVAVRPMVGRPAFTVAIITLGIDVVVRVFASAAIGIELRQVGDPWGLKSTTLFGVEVQQRHLAMIVDDGHPGRGRCSRSSGSPGWAWRCGRPPTTRRRRSPRVSRSVAVFAMSWAHRRRRSPRSAAPSPRSAAASSRRCGSSRWSPFR